MLMKNGLKLLAVALLLATGAAGAEGASAVGEPLPRAGGRRATPRAPAAFCRHVSAATPLPARFTAYRRCLRTPTARSA